MNKTTATAEELLSEVVKRIVHTCQPRQVILFGSRAGGTADADSDLDLLVIEDEPFGENRSRFREIVRLERALGRLKIPTDILVYSADEIDRWRNSRNHIVSRALRTGKIVYARP